MKVIIEIYPKEIKKLLELLDLIDKKPEYIYKGDSSKSQEPIPIDNREVKKSAEPYSGKISDMPYKSVKYNKKEPLPNKELDQSVQEVVNDLSGKEKLPGASNYDELEELISDKLNNVVKYITDDKEEHKKFKNAVKQRLEENDTKFNENDKNTTDEDYTIMKFDIPIHNSASSTDAFDIEQFKKDIKRFFFAMFGIDITK
ncbi:MAG: hypothetical protein [Caudoviricetes sp.]|nr:MAG: hypothetical protein [Caudoviricetes sp.]